MPAMLSDYKRPSKLLKPCGEVLKRIAEVAKETRENTQSKNKGLRNRREKSRAEESQRCESSQGVGLIQAQKKKEKSRANQLARLPGEEKPIV